MLRLAALAGVLLFLVSACSSAPAATGGGGGQLTATLTDSAVQLSQPSIQNGTVTITVKNVGSVNHTLEILKTNLAADKIPADPNNAAKADERGKVGGTTSELKPGESVDVKVDLSAGKYVVICNLPGHYLIGMRAALTVN